jgi:hypothetical protein
MVSLNSQPSSDHLWIGGNRGSRSNSAMQFVSKIERRRYRGIQARAA